MRRLVLALSMAFSLGILFQCTLENKWLILLIVFPLIVFFKNKKIIVLLVAFFIGALNFTAYNFMEKSKTLSTETDIEITGLVYDTDFNEANKCKIKIKTSKNIKIIINVYGKIGEKNYIGRTLKVKGSLNLPNKQRNPKGFSQENYFKTIKVKYYMNVNSEKIAFYSVENHFLNKIGDLKNDFRKTIKANMSPQSENIIMAMTMGDRDRLKEETYEKFQKNGTAHILAISGLHIGILYAFLNILFLKRKNAKVNVIVMIILVFFAIITGGSTSVIRATIMIGLHILSKIIHERYDFICAAAFAALCILINNPYEIFALGFQMSFLATGIIGISLSLAGNLNKKPLVKFFISPAFAVQVGLIPYIAYTFNYVSIIGVIANIPTILMTTILIPLSLLTFFINIAFPSFLKIPLFFLEPIANLLLLVNNKFYVKNITYTFVTSPNLIFIYIFYFLFFLLFSEWGRINILRKKYIKILSRISLTILLSILLTFSFEKTWKDYEIVFIDVGQGQSIHIRDGNNNVLIDGGGKEDFNIGKKILQPYLLKNGVKKVELAIVTHLDTDHYKGIVELCNLGMIKKIGIFEGNRVFEEKILKETNVDPSDIIYLSKGKLLEIGDKTKLEVIGPNKTFEGNENSKSLVMKLLYGKYSLLITGDIDKEVEKNILLENIKADFLQVPHHGSKYSSSDEFIYKVNPSIAFFQVGKNNYGHPDGDVLNKFKIYYRNDLHGAIGIKGLNKENIIISTMI